MRGFRLLTLVALALFTAPFAFGQAPWQVNQPGAHVDVDGAVSSPTAPIDVTNCIGVGGVVTANSVNVGLPWDVAITDPEAGVALGAGGIPTPGGQSINIDLAAPSLHYGGGLQFVNAFLPFSAPVAFTTPRDVSFQMIVIDPGHVDGYALSALNQLHVTASLPVSGPAGDDSSVTVTLAPTPGPGALCSAPVVFFGTSYTEIHVSSNGRVMLVGEDTDFSPSTSELSTDNPFVGFWTDFNPSLGGTITVGVPAAGVVRVDYAGMSYYSEPGTTSSFGIEFDTTNDHVRLTGLLGITANPRTNSFAASGDSQFLGLSGGNAVGATMGANTTFLPGASGTTTNGTDIVGDFFDHGGTPTGGALVGSLGATGTDAVTFFPNAFGNYDWFVN